MNTEQITLQSKSAYNQWCVQWREHAKVHSKFKMKSMLRFENVGVGRSILCVANGYSFEENIETIKENAKHCDILCCDKTLGHLLDHGIEPTYCMVCDANVNYEIYMEKYKDKLKNTILFINACANPKWSHNGNWKDIYFFINKDIIESEKEFCELSGCPNVIPAGTNVSNAMVILITQSDNTGRRNFFGYDKIALIGYDYSWKFGGKYYAFDEDGGGKAQYMKHSYIYFPSGAFGYTSGNLTFSCSWMHKYITTFNLPIVQCSKDSILTLGKVSDLAESMRYNYKETDAVRVNMITKELRQLIARTEELKQTITKIGADHWWSHAATV